MSDRQTLQPNTMAVATHFCIEKKAKEENGQKKKIAKKDNKQASQQS